MRSSPAVRGTAPVLMPAGMPRCACLSGKRIPGKAQHIGYPPETLTAFIPQYRKRKLEDLENLCAVAHAQARYPGLIGEPENAWEVTNGNERVERFSATSVHYAGKLPYQ